MRCDASTRNRLPSSAFRSRRGLESACSVYMTGGRAGRKCSCHRDRHPALAALPCHSERSVSGAEEPKTWPLYSLPGNNGIQHIQFETTRRQIEHSFHSAGVKNLGDQVLQLRCVSLRMTGTLLAACGFNRHLRGYILPDAGHGFRGLTEQESEITPFDRIDRHAPSCSRWDLTF